MALPDSIIYTNKVLLAPKNVKSFALVNPLAGTLTHYISHPENKVSVRGVPLYRVEAIHYTATGTGTAREDGLGYGKKVGAGRNQVSLFINGRLGDTNLLNNPNSRIAVNLGFFGPPGALRTLVDRLPSSGRAAGVKGALEAGLATASAGGTQLGFAWRGTLQRNRDTGVVELNVSGWKIPLAELQAGSKADSIINDGDKPIARVNNEGAYIQGANPFQRADDTRAPKTRADDTRAPKTRADDPRAPNGSLYRNHGDPVAAITGGMLALQDQLQGVRTPNIRTNVEARHLLEDAISRSTARPGSKNAQVGLLPMSAQDRATVQRLLVQLHRHDLNFGSKRIQAAAAAAAVGAPQADAQTRAFVRDVFQGTFRHESIKRYGPADLARDVLLGVNRWTAAATVVFDADPLARDDITLKQQLNGTDGLAKRLQRDGGAIRALGLRVPAKLGAAKVEQIAADGLYDELSKRMRTSGQAITGQSLYEQFKTLPQPQRLAIGRAIQGQLDAWFDPPTRAAVTRRIDGVDVTGSPARVRDVGGVNRNDNDKALQGKLMVARDTRGNPVFWLQGRSTNYLLRGADGKPVTNQLDATARARALISHGGATDLRPLAKGVASTNVRAVGGINGKTGNALQGDLKVTRDTRGNLVFSLQGRGTNYLLRGADGKPVTNQLDATARARALISHGGATDLRPLPPRFVAPKPAATKRAVPPNAGPTPPNQGRAVSGVTRRPVKTAHSGAPKQTRDNGWQPWRSVTNLMSPAIARVRAELSHRVATLLPPQTKRKP
ncbi:MAG: hypothetical protein NTW15_20345 [Burkholderiales bacterium]|nr:hypothetical protein [Burkholderiales bacterium]